MIGAEIQSYYKVNFHNDMLIDAKVIKLVWSCSEVNLEYRLDPKTGTTV